MTDAQRLALLNEALDDLVLTQDGYLDKPLGGHWKAAMPKLKRLQNDLKPKMGMTFPLPLASGGSVCQGLHETAGMPGNWAMDFCDDAGTPVLSPEAGTISKLSGNDPSTAHPNPEGIYGWSVYVKTAAGYVYFITHLGKRVVGVGDRVKLGQEIGQVGNQFPFTGRPNHTHCGVTSPKGQTDAKARITAVSKAPRTPLL